MSLAQIKKRRRRAHAVDPCLGFYPSSPSTNLQTVTKQLFIDTDHDVPPIVTLSSVPSLQPTFDFTQTSSEVENNSPTNEIVNQVTVEEFLRRSAERKPTKRYGGRKRRITDLISDSDGISAFTST
jgi:hypothetical protein